MAMTNNKSVVDALNEIATSAISQTMNKCQSFSNNTQNIIVGCNPNSGDDEIQSWAYNRSCVSALSKRLEEKTWRASLQNARGATNLKAALDTFEAGINRDIMSCVACNFNNITMTSTISMDTECITTDIQEIDIASAITQMTTQSITNNSDWGAGLAKMFGEKNQMTIIQKLSTSINNALQWTNIRENISEELSRTTINLDVNSATTTNIHQDNVIGIVDNFVSSSNYADNVFSEDQWSILNDIYNDESSIDGFVSLSHSFATFLSNMTKSVMGRVIMCAAILAGVAMAIVLFQYLLPLITAKKINSSVKTMGTEAVDTVRGAIPPDLTNDENTIDFNQIEING